MELPRDAAKLVLWFKGLQQPTGFLVLRADAEVALRDFKAGDALGFLSYPDGSGLRSESVFVRSELRGVTVEFPTLQLVGVGNA